MTRPLLVALALALSLTVNAEAATREIVGRASVNDGDTIEIRGQNLRFAGIDAPESDQHCDRDGRPYRCGQQAALFLDRLIAQQTVTCRYEKLDKYKRPVVNCRTGSVDLNRAVIRSGWAIAYGETYIDDEAQARQQKLGLWAGTFTRPAQYRHEPTSKERAAHGDCLIKGNINRDGAKLYHLPDSSGYGKTSINADTGERWFCSAQDAEAAGWRKAAVR